MWGLVLLTIGAMRVLTRAPTGIGNVYPQQDWGGTTAGNLPDTPEAPNPAEGLASYFACHDLCAATAGCAVWTWKEDGRCYLKEAGDVGALGACGACTAGDLATAAPSAGPSASPSGAPTPAPTGPTAGPTHAPTAFGPPFARAVPVCTAGGALAGHADWATCVVCEPCPTPAPTPSPSHPTGIPSDSPSVSPSASPTLAPTDSPSEVPIVEADEIKPVETIMKVETSEAVAAAVSVTASTAVAGAVASTVAASVATSVATSTGASVGASVGAGAGAAGAAASALVFQVQALSIVGKTGAAEENSPSFSTVTGGLDWANLHVDPPFQMFEKHADGLPDDDAGGESGGEAGDGDGDGGDGARRLGTIGAARRSRRRRLAERRFRLAPRRDTF